MVDVKLIVNDKIYRFRSHAAMQEAALQLGIYSDRDATDEHLYSMGLERVFIDTHKQRLEVRDSAGNR